MGTSHRCNVFAYDVSCIIGNYLNACVKVLATVSLTDPGGRILVSFKYLRDKLIHGWYVGCPLPSSFGTPLLTRNTKRAAAARRFQEPAPGPVNSGTNGGSSLGAGRGSGSGGTPKQRRIPADGAPNPNPRLIQNLCLLSGDNTRGMCCNIALPVLGGAAFCNQWHMGFTCFAE